VVRRKSLFLKCVQSGRGVGWGWGSATKRTGIRHESRKKKGLDKNRGIREGKAKLQFKLEETGRG